MVVHSTNLAIPGMSCVLAQAHLMQLMKPLISCKVIETTPILQICAVVGEPTLGVESIESCIFSCILGNYLKHLLC